MNILLLSTYFKPDIASTGVLMAQLAEELVQLGHHLTVVTSMPHYDGNRIWPEYRGKLCAKDTYSGMDVRRVFLFVPQRKGSLLGRLLNYASFNWFSVLSGALSGRYDIVLSPSPPLTNGVAAFALSRLRGVPYVYNVQDIYPDVAIRLGVLTNPRAVDFFKRMESFVYSKAAAISVISEGFCSNLLEKGVPRDKIEIIPNFVDTDFVHPLPRRNRFSAAQDLDDKFVILFAGNVGLSQGLETVLDAASSLAARKDILFLIVGNGAAKPDLQARAKELAIENVRFLPFQPHEALPEMYASSDVCLVPLRKGFTAESVPCKVYTITAAGKPLIAAVDKGSDTWRFVQETGCGLLVTPEEPKELAHAILSLRQDRALRKEMGLGGRERAEREFTPKVIAQKYDLLLTRVTGA